MKINLAGYNIDKSLIDELNSIYATPETISAAYARISRSSLSVDSLRKNALLDIKKARDSNVNIVFSMGHSSISEHAVFNFDIVGVSRLLSELIQKSRFASFTEKSQRYVTIGKDYLVPKEIKNTILEKNFVKTVKNQNKLYKKLCEMAQEYLLKNKFSKNKKDIKIKAKEDARYFLPLATLTQMGITINARSLNRLLLRLDKSNLLESMVLKNKLESIAKKVAPSLIRYTKAQKYELNTFLSKNSNPTICKDISLFPDANNVDDVVLSGFMFESGITFAEAKNRVLQLNNDEKKLLFNKIFSNLESFNKLPRVFELATFSINLCCSSSCFAQLKRHRVFSILKTNYHPKNGFVTPNLIKQLKMTNCINELINETNKLFFKLENKKEGLGSYILTNSHRIEVLIKTNLRELYHFSRLRSDIHAQWEIRNISIEIDKKLRKIAPLSTQKLGGKNDFE